MKRIALVNCISGRGHLDAYARLYARALLELGYEVILIANQDGGVGDYLHRTSPDLKENFKFFPLEPIVDELQNEFPGQRKSLPMYLKAFLIWQTEGVPGIMRRALRIALSFSEILYSKFFQRLHASNKILFATSMGDFAFPSHQNAEAVDLFLHLYLDFMSETSEDLILLNQTGFKLWAGILFHPRLLLEPHLGPESYFSAFSSSGGLFLVPSAVPRYKAEISQSHFFLAPDVADLEVSNTSFALAEKLLAAAAGRKIILLIGSVSPKKGILDFINVVSLAEPSSLFFAVIGEVYWSSFNHQEESIRNFYTAPPENVFIYEGYIQEERDYNTIILAADVVYSVYKSFNSSSNSLTKAAGFKRPILVSANTLMADRVVESGIGAVAPEGNAAGILNALMALLCMPKENFDFESYSEKHSLKVLKQVLGEAVPLWMNIRPINQ